jgi:hypothetical protein
MGAYLMGLLTFLLLHPQLLTVIADVVVNSVSTSGDFELAVFVLTNGDVVDVQNAMSRAYLPLWFWAVTPAALLLLVASGLIFYVKALFQQIRQMKFSREDQITGERGLLVTPFVFQMLFLPVLVVLTNAPTWDGMRHHLYVLPALVVVAALGFQTVLQYLRSGVPRRLPSLLRGGFLAMSSLILIEFVLFDFRLLPYNYAYITPVATVGREPDLTWETDYWGLSVREAFQKTSPGSRVSTWGVSSSWEPFAHLASGEAANDLRENQFYWIKSQRNDFGVPKPGSCEQIDKIDRTVLGKTFTMSRTYICTDVQK